MSFSIKRASQRVALAVAIWGGAGCSSDDDPLGSPGVTSVYYGVGFHDPWYYGGYYDDPDIIVTPPSDRPDRPNRPTQPIARPTPRPMPSIPSAPRVSGRR
ncbi:MAG TPA: hypothetical protein PLX89_10040 [Verrucomicrobiota bacterium]|nr:hypothetical protein [Verrucomicrobiota bacterium]